MPCAGFAFSGLIEFELPDEDTHSCNRMELNHYVRDSANVSAGVDVVQDRCLMVDHKAAATASNL